MESTSKYFQSSCSVFHLFLYHSGILPSLTWITTIDLQPLSLFLFLSLPNHSPNLRSKQNDIPKVPLKWHHCLFNNSLRWLSEKKKTNSYQSLLPPRHILAICPLRQAGLFKFLHLLSWSPLQQCFPYVACLLNSRCATWPPYGFLSQNLILPFRILIIICKSILFFSF